MSESLAKQTEIAFMGMNEITKGERAVRRERAKNGTLRITRIC